MDPATNRRPSGIEWQSEEYEYRHKSPDWFWALGIMAVAGAVVAILFGNFLFAIVIILGSVTLSLHAKRTPEIVNYRIDKKGVRAGKTLYPYASLSSFCIDEDDKYLIIESEKLFVPHIFIPLPREADMDEIHDYLLQNLEEKEHGVPITQKLMDFFGV